MTLYKKITLMIVMITTWMLATIMTINYNTSKKYMEDELYKSTVNSLLAISNKLTQNKVEKSYIQSVIDSEFDSGYYQTIEFVSNDNNWTYKQSYKDEYEDIPQWFVQFMNIKPKMISKDIFVDWYMVGELSLQVELSTLYQTLYKTFIQLIFIFIFIFILSSLVFGILLKIILRPLIDIQKQADAIAHHKYIIQKNIPKTVELRDVVLSMNTMVQKIEFMFTSVNNQLREQKTSTYTDSLTKLKSREYLIDKLPEYLKLDAEVSMGVNIMISISGMIEINKHVGRKKADQLYIEIADLFRDEMKEFNDIIIARMNGTEFDIFLPNYSIDTIKEKIISIKTRANQIMENYDTNSSVLYLSLGVCEYSHTQTINELLSLTDHALQKAKNNYSHIYYQTLTSKFQLKGKDQWRKIFNQSLEKESFSFIVCDVINTQTLTHYHSIINIVMETQEKKYMYEEFMPFAIELGFSSKIYTQIISKILIDKEDELASTNVLRLPYDYLYTKSSYENIKKLCLLFSYNNQHSLTLEISDKFIRKNPILVEAYKSLLDTHNISLGIFEFIGEGENFDYLRKLNPDYIKMNASFLLLRTPQELLSLQTLMKTLNIIPIATEVEDENTSNSLKARDIYTMQGAHIGLAHH